MKQLCVIVLSFVLLVVLASCFPRDLAIVPREEWGARDPLEREQMQNPVPFVVIHHSYIPAACYTNADCEAAMRWMQDLHQFNNSWSDIGYSFAVGGDNRAYEGRGWSTVGAHAPRFNNISIGICVIGDWRFDLPPISQLNIVQQLIELGVRTGKISQDYQLIGHRQVRDTECPGDRLFEEIQTWEHFCWDPEGSSESRSRLNNGNNIRKRKV